MAQNSNAVSIIQVSKRGESIQSFSSVRAASSATGLTPYTINKSLEQKWRDDDNFFWFKKDEYLLIVRGRTRSVVQYEISNKKRKTVGTYQSVKDASEKTSISENVIRRILGGNILESDKFVWEDAPIDETESETHKLKVAKYIEEILNPVGSDSDSGEDQERLKQEGKGRKRKKIKHEDKVGDTKEENIADQPKQKARGKEKEEKIENKDIIRTDEAKQRQERQKRDDSRKVPRHTFGQDGCVDVIIFCATSEEADHCRKVFVLNDCKVERIEEHDPLPYHCLIMSTEKERQINIRIYNSPIMGSVSTAIYVTHLLSQLKPLWVFMTGVCAGNPQADIKLGDLIVAKDVIDLNAGKMTLDGFRADVITYETDAIPYATELIGLLKEESELVSRELDPDKTIIWKTKLSVRRPLTDAIVRRRLLRAVYDVQAIKVYQAEKSALEGDKFSSDSTYYALQNRGLEVDEIRKSTMANSPQSLPATINYETFRTTLKELSSAGELGQPRSECYSFPMDSFNTMRSRINNGEYIFPEASPNVRIGTLGTDSSAVRGDLDNDKWTELVKRSGKRHLCGLDMEGLGLYAAVEVYKETTKQKIRCLLVKAVSDLGDHDKGDSYHDYGKQVAAAFVYRFIRCRDFKVRSDHKQIN